MEFPIFFPIWDKLTAQQRQKLRDATTHRSIKKGTILRDGPTDCLGILLIHSGQLRAYTISEEGREITIYRLVAMDICLFTASCMMPNIQFEITVEAEKDSEMWVIPPDVYRSIMEESAPMANYTYDLMSSRFSDVMWLFEQILWKSFDKRLAGFLLGEMKLEGSSQLKLTHEMIGNHLGTAREVVTRMLSYFQNEGMVRLSRVLWILLI